jgi:hypothetical protein
MFILTVNLIGSRVGQVSPWELVHILKTSKKSEDAVRGDGAIYFMVKIYTVKRPMGELSIIE